jgi:glycerol-3-phosphate dehydrogenase
MAIKIAKKIKIEMPITELVSKADNKNFDLQTEVENMMKRPPKLEWL